MRRKTEEWREIVESLRRQDGVCGSILADRIERRILFRSPQSVVGIYLSPADQIRAAASKRLDAPESSAVGLRGRSGASNGTVATLSTFDPQTGLEMAPVALAEQIGGIGMATSPKESTIVAAIMRRLASLRAFGFKVHGGPFQMVGIPDIVGCIADSEGRGRFYALEAKRPGCKPTVIQTVIMDRIRKAGGIVGVVHSADEAQAVLESGLGSTLSAERKALNYEDDNEL